MDDDLRRREKSTLVFLLSLGIVCVLALWAFEARFGVLADLDRYGYPYLVVLFAACLALLFTGPRYQSLPMVVGYCGFSLYFIVVLGSFVILPGADRIYTVANVLQWMPMLYVSAFVFFRARTATWAALLVFVLSLAPAALALARDSGDRADLLIVALIVNGYAAHLLIILCLSLVGVLRRRYEQASRRAYAFEAEAQTDQLTGVANRRGVADLVAQMQRAEGCAISVILFDVDHFKQVNDAFGHEVGDAILRSTAQLIRSQLGPRDMLGRWGGEEFIVIAHSRPPDSGLQLAERVRGLVNAAVHPLAGAVKLSAGIAPWPEEQSFEDSLRAADKALYRAKAGGRDRAELADTGSESKAPIAIAAM